MGSETEDRTPVEFDPQEAFAILGNETRMEILQSLWEAYDPFAETNGLSFSELYEAVTIGDSGQFNYHLDKLRDLYVEQSEEKYRLTTVGLKLVQSVIAGAGQEFDYDATEVDAECRLCGAPIELTYDGIRVYFVCTDCEGNFDGEEYPDGTLWGHTIPPAGVVNRSPEQLFATVSFLDWPQKAMLTGNVCPQCRGVLEQTIEICEQHDSSNAGPCSECGYTQPVQVNWLCTVCKYHAAGAPTEYINHHPAVIAFRHDHRIDFGYPYTTSTFDETQQQESIRQEMEYDVEVLATDPPELCVTVGYEEESITLILDDNLTVCSVTRTRADSHQ